MNESAWHEWLGAAAAFLTTIAFLPQAAKVIRTRHTADLSLPMYAIFALGVFLWLCYGLVLGRWPIIVANVVTLPLVLVILGVKIRYG